MPLLEECRSKVISEACIRCKKGNDGMIGFFAVGFVRDTSTHGDINDEKEEEEWQGIP